jgi:hypothetical protein
MAVAMMADKLNTAIMAYVAAILNVGATLVDDGTDTFTLSHFIDGSALMGDRAQRVACWVMHSKPYNDLLKTAVTGANVLFNFGDINIVTDGFGRPIIVTDSAELKDGSDYHTLGIVPGGVVVEDNGTPNAAVDTGLGKENLTREYQVEWDYNLGLLGFEWNQTNGGPSPNDAAIGTGTNWTKTATDVKDCAGVIVTTH